MVADYSTDAIPELGTNVQHEMESGSPAIPSSSEVTFDDGQKQGNPQPAAQGQQPAAQPPPQMWDGKEYALNFRGKQIVPRDKSHLINLAQQGYSYETRAQELAKRESELQQRSSRYEQLEQLNQAFETNPILKQQLMQMYQQAQSGQQPVEGQQQQMPDYSPLLEKYQSLEQKLNQYEASQADQALNQEIETMQKKFAREDWNQIDETGQTLVQQIIKHAYKLGGVPLDTAYKDIMWEHHQQQAQAEALKAQAEQRQKQVKSGVVASPASKQVQAPGAKQLDIRSLNYNDLAREALSNR
jgi:hypothetical protein